MIVVRQLVKRFDGATVLDRISLEVRQGEVAAIIGPSGGGKSTFLRCLNGLEAFEAGSVRVDDIEVHGQMTPEVRKRQLGLVRRRVGMVFQQFNLFPHRTVLGNVIEAPISVLGKPRDEAVAKARALLDRVGMGDKLDRWPETLSGGQQQRVAIARALAMGPDVILFDEPTSALDPRMAAEVEAVIADLARGGQTMLVVTHSMRLARRAAHTIHVFERGQVKSSGPPEEILAGTDEPGSV